MPPRWRGCLKLRDNLGAGRTVQVAAGVGVGGVDAEGDGEAPAEGDGEEVVAVAFGPAKFDVGDDAAADGAHDERAEELGKVGADGVHGMSFRP